MLRFLRALTKPQQEKFAATVGTTRTYLYQLAAQPNPNPNLQMALAIRRESERIAKEVMTEPLSLEDLLIGVPPQPTKK